MSDKKKFAAPSSAVIKSKRPSTVGVASTSLRGRTDSKNANMRAKNNKNMSIIGDGDTTIRKEARMPDFDAEYRQIAYGKFLRAMLEECLLDEKIEREETHMDIQMAQLSNRFQMTVEQLDKTNRRLKDISFVAEQKRLINLKSQDCSQYYEMSDKSNVQDILKDLAVTEQACLDKLETKNIDIGYDKNSGHKQLLDAVNDAIEGLEQIKKHSNLDLNKFKEYEKSQKSLEELEKERLDLSSLKLDFENKFPKFSEKLFKEASEKISKMIENEDDDDD